MTAQGEKLKALREEFRNFSAIPFPRGSLNDEVDQLHAELAELDDYVAGQIQTLLNEGRIPVQSLHSIDGLEQRLKTIASKGDRETVTTVQSYLNYLYGLNSLIQKARSLL